ncbi:alpha/beta hydrolase [Rhizobium anhuiense]|uniref:Alpha/beta hydrolase n=1 Tax=Rhizobium anhuiense TaxID=1184720 RepID=A0ABX4IWK4_9HYPH|nr:alpha/beta fold hydrolase [Rhizobium anhuiense]PDS41173.1 alpha/beta hydrolase [Rhizobium anhuiense]PDS46412.1 alpha/beta hydrolase [Rhizobium anhuiense]
MKNLDVATRTGTVLNGVLFPAAEAETVVIAITGVHGNFYSNPFYLNIGQTLSASGIDFVYAQTRDAFGEVESVNTITAKPEQIGSFNEDFTKAEEDVAAYIDFAEQAGYKRIILAGHSLGANKIIYYLSRNPDPRVAKFILLSPANIKHLTSVVTEGQKELVREYIDRGMGQVLLPFPLLGWLPCIADTAYQWLYTDTLDNVHVEADGDFSQAEKIRHQGALLIGTYDRFTYGDPVAFLSNINAHMPAAKENRLIFIQKTGHTYQGKEQELAESILELVQNWQTGRQAKEERYAVHHNQN